MKPRDLAFLVGSLGSLAFVVLSVFKLGLPAVFFFMFYVALAFQDAMKGRIPLLAFVPIMLLPVIYWGVFWQVYAPVFGVLLLIWSIVGILQKKVSRLDPEACYFGLGDVFGIPLALSLSLVYVPFWGLPIFAGVMTCVMPFFLRAKQRRFLPWLIPSLATAFIVAVVL